MLSSPRRPSRTIRIFSSAEYCLRVARRMSLTTFSAVSFAKLECCLIFVPLNVTMSQKPSLLQSTHSVSQALTADTLLILGFVVQNVQQRIVNFQVSIVFDEPQFAEFVHEKADASPGGADHRCERLLADFRY